MSLVNTLMDKTALAATTRLDATVSATVGSPIATDVAVSLHPQLRNFSAIPAHRLPLGSPLAPMAQ